MSNPWVSTDVQLFPPLRACHTFDPTLPPCSSRRWRRSCARPPPCSLFKIISEWSLQWKSQTAAVRAARAFFLSQTPLTVISKKCKVRLVCCTTCSILSLSLTHAHMHALRGCTGGEQVGESKSPPNGQILFICSS